MEGGVNMTTRNVTAADFGSRYEAPGAELVRIALFPCSGRPFP